jgi:hypothetical protein
MMEFHEYPTMHQFTEWYTESKGKRLKVSRREFYKSGNLGSSIEGYAKARSVPTTPVVFRIVSEKSWYEHGRPYYNVYPYIIPLLLRLNLGLTMEVIKPTFPVMLFRFPRNQGDDSSWLQTSKVQSILGYYPEDAPGMFLQCMSESGEFTAQLPVNLSTPYSVDEPGRPFLATPTTTYEEYFDHLEASTPTGPECTRVVTTELLKIIISLCMLGKDPSIIQPVVLSKDRRAWEATGDWKYVEKARRRGVYGWEIGRNIEEQIAKEIEQETREHGGVSPHWRNGCPALCWTGEGRKIPEIRWRNGCIVNRERLLAMPTGYLDEN